MAILVNLSAAFPSIQNAVLTIAYVLGILATALGLLHFVSEQRRGQEGGKRGLLAIIGGMVLTSIVATYQGLTETFFGSGDPAQVLSAVTPGADPVKTVIDVLIYAVVLTGWIFGVRGGWLIASSGNDYQSGKFAKGLVRLGAGVIAVNIVPFLLGLAASVGVEDAATMILRR